MPRKPPGRRARSMTSFANRDHSQSRHFGVLAALPRVAGGGPGAPRKNYALWSANAFHPSLRFKSIGKPNWSVRVGDHYRAVGKFADKAFLWEWIGTHEEYNQRF